MPDVTPWAGGRAGFEPGLSGSRTLINCHHHSMLPLVCVIEADFCLVFLVAIALAPLLTTRVRQRNRQLQNHKGQKQQIGSVAGQLCYPVPRPLPRLQAWSLCLAKERGKEQARQRSEKLVGP